MSEDAAVDMISAGVVVSVRVLRTSDFINDLDTQLLYNRLSLVVFDRRNPRLTGHIAGVKVTGGHLFLRKKMREKMSNKLK